MSYYELNREKILERNKKYYHKRKTDPDFKLKLTDRNRSQYRKKVEVVYTEEDRKKDEEFMINQLKFMKYLREQPQPTIHKEPMKYREDPVEAFINWKP